MKKIIILFLLTCLWGKVAFAQHFEYYVKHNLDSTEKAYKYYKTGLKVLDKDGKEIRQSEPIYSKVVFADGFDRAAASIPIISIEKTGMDYWRQVWICLDYDLKPVFVFPSHTVRVIKIVDGMFLYTDGYATHPYTFGLVDHTGEVIFEAPYDRIYLEDGYYVGVKNLTEPSACSDILTWAVEIRKASSDSVFVIHLQTPKNDSCGLWGDNPDDLDEDRRSFESILRESPFQRGLNHVVHLRIKEASECFKDALNNKNPQIVLCAHNNIDALKLY